MADSTSFPELFPYQEKSPGNEVVADFIKEEPLWSSYSWCWPKGRDILCDKSLRVHCLQTSRCDKAFVWCTNSEFGRVGMRTSFPYSIWRKYMTCSHWLTHILSQRLVAAICRRRVHTLRQRCYRSFCRCDVSHKFKPVWIRATRRGDKILSQRHSLSHITRGDMSQQHVSATCCSDVSPSVSRP